MKTTILTLFLLITISCLQGYGQTSEDLMPAQAASLEKTSAYYEEENARLHYENQVLAEQNSIKDTVIANMKEMITEQELTIASDIPLINEQQRTIDNQSKALKKQNTSITVGSFIATAIIVWLITNL